MQKTQSDCNHPIRKVEYAMIAGIGPVSARELIGLPPAQWIQLRNDITDARNRIPREDLAKCFMCGEPVFVQAKHLGNRNLPLFSHFKNNSTPCPWYTGETSRPDDLRAIQYGGNQKSPAHDMICQLIAELAELDERCTSVTVEKYLPPTQTTNGRYPDVLVKMANRRPIAFEAQLSNTFQTEISARCLHYPRENVDLIWILHGIDFDSPYIRQSFHDVITRHRGNAFSLDREAVAKSRLQKKLILKCDLLNIDGIHEGGSYVSLDDLSFPESGLPYFKDMIVPALLKKGRDARTPWFNAFNSRPSDELKSDFSRDVFTSALKQLSESVPGMRGFENDKQELRTFYVFVAVAMTIVRYAISLASGDTSVFHNYADKNHTIQAMLNNKFGRPDMGLYADLLSQIIRRTTAASILQGSVAKHLGIAMERGDGNFHLSDTPQNQAAQHLFPELFAGMTRFELQKLDALPRWVNLTAIDSEANGV